MPILDSTTTEDDFKSCLDPRNVRLHAYQSHILLVLWLNPHLTELMLGMARSDACWDSKEIEEAWRYAMSSHQCARCHWELVRVQFPQGSPL